MFDVSDQTPVTVESTADGVTLHIAGMSGRMSAAMARQLGARLLAASNLSDAEAADRYRRHKAAVRDLVK